MNVSQDYTLLVDETGVDGISQRAMYVGCLFQTSELAAVETRVKEFNQRCLDDPHYSRKIGFVNNANEARHFTEDNPSISVKFIDEVLRRVPCRVYAVFDTPKKSVKETKQQIFKIFIDYVRQVREIQSLNIVIEQSGKDDKDLEECGAVFKTKDYLPLCIPDYYGAILHRFHEKRLQDLASGKKLKSKEFDVLQYRQYALIIDRISLERDLGTGEMSSRRSERYFLKQIQDIIALD